MEIPQPIQYQRTDSDQSLEDPLYNIGLYDRFDEQDWQQQENLFDERFMLFPDGTGSLSDKHSLLGSEVDAHDSKRQEMGNDNEKKKPGRKPITNEPTTKRKAQNRAAQRAFRERKENHVKVLEARVSELEKQNNSQSMENQYLKAQLAKLRSGKDMSFAQSNDFTFDFPPPSMSSRSHSIGSSAVSPNEKVPARSDCPSLCSSDTSPQSTVEKDFNAAAMPRFSRGSSYPDSQYSSNDSGIYSASSSNPLEAEQKPTPETDVAGQDNQFIFSESFLSQTPQYTFNSLDYRDNNDFNSFDVDPPLFDTSLIGFDPADLTDPTSELFGVQAPAEPIVKTESVSESSISPHPATLWPEDPVALRQVEYAENPQNGCPEVWRKIVTHPKFASFDLDELCDMFSKKNKCGQTQEKFLAEADWDKFDKKLDEFAEKSKNKLML